MLKELTVKNFKSFKNETTLSMEADYKRVFEDTGEIIPVYLFVATLPYSQYSYVEATLSMDEESTSFLTYSKGTE
jgi:transposase